MFKAPSALALLALSATMPLHADTKQSDEYQDFNPGKTSAGSEWVKAIVIRSPELRSNVKGDVKVEFEAPGMTAARALCWQQPTNENKDAFGHDQIVADLDLGSDGKGSFVFPAEKFPNGPISVRILAHNASGQKDIREIQLFNEGGVAWNQGMPKDPPPAAKGMKLVFDDDFTKTPSISKDGQGATYSAHKPGGGDFSGWPFADPEGPSKPFDQKGTWLRIHASKPEGTKGRTGILSSARADGTGFFASAPCYFECRFTAQSAPGTWAAFWTLTKDSLLKRIADPKSRVPGDELDIVEAYGGVGKKNPNHPGYSVTSHFWFQTGPDGKPLKNINKRVSMMDVGGKSYWSTTFHTYGVKVTDKDTIYYLDNIEVLKHPTNEVSKKDEHFFLINYAIGGISGWQIDLERDGNASDMWVDYVRVYQGEKGSQ
jgi:hypothetical protein